MTQKTSELTRHIPIGSIAPEGARPFLRWGIKNSLFAYIQGSGGTVTMSTSASLDTQVLFPLRADELVGAHRVMRFGGAVRFQAHSGLMDLGLAEPWLELGAEEGWVSVIPQAHGVSAARLRLAVVHPDETDPSAFSARLAQEGTAVFDHNYSAGTVLDPLKIDGLEASNGAVQLRPHMTLRTPSRRAIGTTSDHLVSSQHSTKEQP